MTMQGSLTAPLHEIVRFLLSPQRCCPRANYEAESMSGRIVSELIPPGPLTSSVIFWARIYDLERDEGSPLAGRSGPQAYMSEQHPPRQQRHQQGHLQPHFLQRPLGCLCSNPSLVRLPWVP